MASWSLAYRPWPAPGVHAQCRAAQERGGFSPGELDGRRGVLVAVQDQGGHLNFLEFPGHVDVGVELQRLSSTRRGVSTIIRVVQSTRPGDAPGLDPKYGPAASKLAHHYGTFAATAA
jgi:hypothetical protein